MVMIFANEKVREFLMKNGIVYTYRKMHPKTADGIRPQIGKDWATDRRTGKKIMDVVITPVEAIKYPHDINILRKYVSRSGFSTTKEWAVAIKSLNPRTATVGWIYKVIRRFKVVKI